MIFCVVTHVSHIKVDNSFYAYSPYVREMNIWIKYSDEVIIVAPMEDREKTAIDSNYEHKNIEFIKISAFNVLGVKSIFLAFFKMPKICVQIFKAMKAADHIHLRCPGNIGLLGCFIQIVFPNKPKTAKYAGNWDPNAKQPLSYRLQKWILSNTFLTRKMQVLVYGDWKGISSNIKPFFTATYLENDKAALQELDLKQQINFVFVGTLVSGKNSLYAIQLTQALYDKGYNVALNIYGEGIERIVLEQYILKNNLREYVFLHGNENPDTLKRAYKKSAFVILPSKSEGWPKAIAEGMFFGCIPVATPVSCVPYMLDYGKRGILLDMDLEKDVANLEKVLKNKNEFNCIRKNASNWSGNYTLESFETEIRKIVS